MTPDELADLAHLRRARDRIERAKALLRQGMSVTDTCVAVGCTSLGSFSSRFTEIVGATPSQYRDGDHSGLAAVPACVAMYATGPQRTPDRSETTEQDRRSTPAGAPGQPVDIVLFQPRGGCSQTEGDALLTLVTQGSLQAAIFRTDDLDATFERVRVAGAEVLQEPASQPWGARDCAFRDPSGNLVKIAQA